MLSVLLTISFMIHFITLFIIIIFYQRFKLKNNEDPVEFERMLQQYLNQIKEENNQLLQQLESTDSRDEQPFPSHAPESVKVEEMSEYEPPVKEIEEEDELETSPTANVLSLAEQGYTQSDIAQKLKCGKTEVELIVKFQGEKSHNT